MRDSCETILTQGCTFWTCLQYSHVWGNHIRLPRNHGHFNCDYLPARVASRHSSEHHRSLSRAVSLGRHTPRQTNLQEGLPWKSQWERHTLQLDRHARPGVQWVVAWPKRRRPRGLGFLSGGGRGASWGWLAPHPWWRHRRDDGCVER